MSAKFPEIRFRLVTFSEDCIVLATSEPYEIPKTIKVHSHFGFDPFRKEQLIDTVKKYYECGKKELRYFYIRMKLHRSDRKRLSPNIIKRRLWNTDLEIRRLYTTKSKPEFINYPMKKLDIGFKNRLCVFDNYINSYSENETEIYRLFCLLIKWKMLE